jgi:hypothetical protein
MFGFFGKYNAVIDFAGRGRTTTFRFFVVPYGDFYGQAKGNFIYLPSNTGALPDLQNMLTGSFVAFNWDSRTRFSEPAISLKQLRYNSTALLTPVTRDFRAIAVDASLIKRFQFFGGGSGGGSFIEGACALPYLPNANEYYFPANGVQANGHTYITSITGAFPQRLTIFKFHNSGDTYILSSIQHPFPKSIIQLQLAVNNTTLGADVPRLIANITEAEELIFANDDFQISAGANAITPIPGNLDISHIQNWKKLCLISSLLTDITYSLSDVNITHFKLMSAPLVPDSKVRELTDLFFDSNAGAEFSIFNCDASFHKLFKDSDFKASLTSIVLGRNYLTGTIVATTPNNVDNCYLYSGDSMAESGYGKSASPSSATAGALSLQDGGAGGNGGTNANGTAGNSYGGGGGGAGRTSLDRKGGAGANGLIRVTYLLAGVTTTQTFTASGSWSTPVGVTELFIECTGAGGSGGTRGTTNGASGGGGGGAFAFKKLAVTASTLYNYTVGVGGAAGSASVPTDGFDGGDTYWDAGADVKAAGGKKGLATQTGGAGGAEVDCVGSIVKSGGNGSTRATNASPGGGGGGAAGSTGLKMFIPHLDLSGMVSATLIYVIHCQAIEVNLPANNVCTVLYLAGNRLDTSVDTDLISQIVAMGALETLGFSVGNPLQTSIHNGQYTQGLGVIDLSASTSLTTLIASNCGLSGNIKLPSTLTTIEALLNSLTGIDTGTISSLQVMNLSQNPAFNFDFTRVPNILIIRVTSTAVVTIDLSGRTSTAVIARIEAQSVTALTSVIMPTNAVNAVLGAGTNQGVISLSLSSALASITNLENLSYSSLVTAFARTVTVNGCALNQDLKFGVNNFLPTTIGCQDNGMSQANVDQNLLNLYNAELAGKYNTTTFSKTLNIGGTNAAPSGIYQNVVTPTTGNEYKWELVNVYGWTITSN